MNKWTGTIRLASSKIAVNLKEKQFEAILSFMPGKDVFVSLPTGYGKSLIYSILPLAFDIFKGKNQQLINKV